MTFRIQKNWRWLVALGAVFVPGIVSGALTLPFKFTAGTPIKAADVNANFEALRAKLDALSATPALPTVGTVTLPGILTAAPIRKFTQAMSMPWPSAAGGGAGKPTLTDIEIVRDAGTGSPVIAQNAASGKVLATADILLGSMTVHLTNAIISSLKVIGAQGDRPQEALTLSFQTIDWTYAPPGLPARTVTYNRATATTGGGSGAVAFKYAFAPAGVAVDTTFARVTSYTHAMGCPAPVLGGGGAACKVAHSPIAVQKGVGAETLDEIGHSLSGAVGNSVDLEWFSAAATVNNSVKLTNAIAVGVSLTTEADGSFTETASFGYAAIAWQAGTLTSTWDILKNAP